MGGAGPVSYQWSSTCRNCSFQTANSNSVNRPAVHSGDTGIHTCTATSGSSIRGNGTISITVVGKPSINCMFGKLIQALIHCSFKVISANVLLRCYIYLLAICVGAGIHVFIGGSPGSLPNNGIVISANMDLAVFRFRFICRSDSTMSNVGMLIGPDGTVVTTGDVFTIAHQQPGELTVENKLSQNVLTASDQGMYTCHIPLQSGDMRDINVGIYPSGFYSKYDMLKL